jgi:hypothetical protein
LYAAYNNRTTKYRCLGWNTIPEKWIVSPNLDKAELCVKSVTDTGLRIMLKPNSTYFVTINGNKNKLKSDSSGGLNITFPAGKVTILIQQSK